MTGPDPRTGRAGEDPLSVGLDRPASGTPQEPAPPSAPAGQGRARNAGRTIGTGVALALLLFVTVVLVLFVVFNGETVPISLVFTDVEAPLVVALLIAAALGGLIASLAGLLARTRRRHR